MPRVNITEKLEYVYNGEIYPEVGRYLVGLHDFLVVFKRPNGLHMSVAVRPETAGKNGNIRNVVFPKWAPWTLLDEVPIDAWFKHINDKYAKKIIALDLKENKVLFPDSDFGMSLQGLFDYYKFTQNDPRIPNVHWITCGKKL